MKLTFGRENLTSDISAAVTMAIVAIPDAIASALLAGVKPTYGFNALMVGVPVGSLFTSSQFKRRPHNPKKKPWPHKPRAKVRNTI
jgi:MFS superfamily sulfate permease-like transporter